MTFTTKISWGQGVFCETKYLMHSPLLPLVGNGPKLHQLSHPDYYQDQWGPVHSSSPQVSTQGSAASAGTHPPHRGSGLARDPR